MNLFYSPEFFEKKQVNILQCGWNMIKIKGFPIYFHKIGSSTKVKLEK
jgi:hypothetical protein